jgi:hypothetical protein
MSGPDFAAKNPARAGLGVGAASALIQEIRQREIRSKDDQPARPTPCSTMIRMLSRTTLLAVLLAAFGAVACEPPTLDPDHASGSSADSTGSKSSKKKSTSKNTATDDDDDDTSADDKGTTTKPSKQTTNTGSGTTGTTTGGSTTPASFSAVYSGLKSSCGSCHLSGAAGAPTFFGDTEATTYDNFVNQSFNTSPSPLVTKGQHSGPALTASQQSAVEAWVAADPAQ